MSNVVLSDSRALRLVHEWIGLGPSAHSEVLGKPESEYAVWLSLHVFGHRHYYYLSSSSLLLQIFPRMTRRPLCKAG